MSPGTHEFGSLIDAGVLAVGDGYRAKNEELGGDGPIFLRAGHVGDGVLDLEGTERFRQELAPRLGSKASRPGDVLVVTKGWSTGRVAYVGPSHPPMVYSPHTCFWRSLQHEAIDPGFLRYWSRGHEAQSQLASFRMATDVHPYLSLVAQRKLRITIPAPPVQKAAGRILGALDDKIELNRRTSETLEAMARAIFQSWFVDFDPVRAKMEGRQPEGMDAETAKLFPDVLETLPDGVIPEGWGRGTLGDVAEQVRDVIAPQEVPSSTPYIALEHMPQRSISLSNWDTAERAQSQKGRFRRGQILFGKLRPYFHKVGVAPVDGICSTDIVVVEPRKAFFGVVLGHLSSDAFVAYANAGSDGTRMPRTSWARMQQYPLAVPDPRTASIFARTARTITEQIFAGNFESRALIAVRDELLPKLLSGELRVPDAERAVSAVL